MPKEPHISKRAKGTTVRLTREDYEAHHEIAKAREAKNDDRTRLNDVLLDGLWELLKKETGKTRRDIEAALPPLAKQELDSNVTTMPRKAKEKKRGPTS